MNITGSFDIRKTLGADTIFGGAGVFVVADTPTGYADIGYMKDNTGKSSSISFDASKAWTGVTIRR